MNTNHLKKFAQAARRKLIDQVGAKLEYVLSHDSAELREKDAQIQKLKEELSRMGKDQLVEKVAYTWFNRLMALRFMDANDYQPSGIRIVSQKDGFTLPEVLDEAKQGNISDEISVDKKKLLAVLDGKIPSTNPQNEVYRYLLIGACNALHNQFPFLFESINDHTELLLPDDLTSEFSIVHDIVKGMSPEDCQQVEIIGWLYQFYIAEKKDEVFASKSKVKKEDIPAATQLFTPRWIVEYMVQNTLGKLWLQNRPQSRLRDHMPYFIESASLKTEDYLHVDSVEEITLLDQACGSGHILVYAFELLTKIYEEEGYNQSDIPQLIIEKNLYGFEIDERASQLSGFSLLMKARGYYRRLFRKGIYPNILCFKDIEFGQNELENYYYATLVELNEEFKADLICLEQATNLGSLIQPHCHNFEFLDGLVGSSKDLFVESTYQKLHSAAFQLELLNKKFHCVVDNPPYMGGGNMNKGLSDFVKAIYPDSKSDLMAAFMECGLNSLLPNGFLGMINQHSWMFLSSYEKLREKLIENVFFDTLLHLGPRTFPEIGGEVVQNASFTFVNAKYNYKGSYIRLIDSDNSELKRSKTLEATQNPNCRWFYTANQKDFDKIPGSPIGYWLNRKSIELFEGKKIKDSFQPKSGLSTTDNLQFLRLCHEVESKKVGYGFKSTEEAKNSKYKWFPYNKGGQFRRWYGNHVYYVNWENDGKDIRDCIASDPKKQVGGRIVSHEFYFKQSVNWSALSSGLFSCRYSPQGYLFDSKGPAVFFKGDYFAPSLIGLLNSKVAQEYLNVLSPTLDYNQGPVGRIPYIEPPDTTRALSINCINISKEEWDMRETSWGFGQNKLIVQPGRDMEECYDLFCHYWTKKYHQTHQYEEELNRQFIEIYGLQDELTPDVPLEDITILNEETSIENGQLVFHRDEILAQLVSYAVGCMFGRYSLDKEGLILANQGETLKDYFSNIDKSESEASFLPDHDAIIPVLEDEWFEDDIVGRLYDFIKATYGDKDFQKNLTFVEESLGMIIRKYFVKEFYSDHIKRYRKRPIYWMFSSPKGHFNVLIYLHRYTPDTINNILNNYLREFIQKLKSRKAHFEQLQISGTTAEQNRAAKQIDKLDKMILDCEEYERDILYPLATERISIDLDDGVLVNYNKFGKAVREVPGLNDKKTKKKVREFDWIDVTSIRD